MYNVGQTLYLLSKKNKIVPARVESVITVRKLDGQHVSHDLILPGHDGLITLEKLNVDVFTSPPALKEHLMKILQDKVDEDLADIKNLIHESWGSTDDVSHDLVQDQDQRLVEVNESSEQNIEMPTTTQLVELENGIKARIHIPKDFT